MTEERPAFVIEHILALSARAAARSDFRQMSA
jgi:hypothetical protein